MQYLPPHVQARRMRGLPSQLGGGFLPVFWFHRDCSELFSRPPSPIFFFGLVPLYCLHLLVSVCTAVLLQLALGLAWGSVWWGGGVRGLGVCSRLCVC